MLRCWIRALYEVLCKAKWNNLVGRRREEVEGAGQD